MQLTTWLVETVKSGKVTVSQNNVEALEIKAEDKKISVNATDKNLVKELISSVREANSKRGIKGSVDQIRVAIDMRPLLKEIVEDLCKEDVTVTIFYKGDRVATIGSEANSKFTRFVTGTKGIEINSPTKLIEMGI